MEIKGYTWITGKIIHRLWGTEYRYTVINSNGKYFDDIVMLPDSKTDDKTIIALITKKLEQIDVEPEVTISPEEAKESEIEAFLVTKGLLEIGQDYQDIKSKDEIEGK